jgi:long-chain acyl-CoA synthetase
MATERVMAAGRAADAGRQAEDWVSLVAAAQARSSCAVVTAEQAWSGGQLLSHASAAARWLAGWGLPRGRPVPALLEASSEALALVLAGAAVRRPIAPLGPRLTVRELAGCIGRLDAPCIVAQPQFAATAWEVARELGREVAVPARWPCPGEPLPVPAPHDTAVVLHTSGTTGHRRAVHYRHDRLARRVQLSPSLQQLPPGSVFATAEPFHHIAGLGMIMVALAAGATTWLSPADHRVAVAREELLQVVGRAAPGVEVRIWSPDPDDRE